MEKLRLFRLRDHPRALLQRLQPCLRDIQRQDERSVAYVLVEMLTGQPIRGQYLEVDRLVEQVVSIRDASSFLRALLERSCDLKDLLDHPYLHESSMKATNTILLGGREMQRQRHTIAQLTLQEKTKCEAEREQCLADMRVWFTQFQRRHNRKPHIDERPASITRMQRRCHMLSDRIADLEKRLQTLHKSFYNAAISSKPSEPITFALYSSALTVETRGGLSGNEPDKEHEVKATVSDELLPTLGVRVSPELREDGTGKRSPAQVAFLERLSGAQQGAYQNQPTGTLASDSTFSARDQPMGKQAAQQLMQQRKAICHLMDDIEHRG